MEVGLFAIQFLSQLPGLIKAGINVSDIIERNNQVIETAQAENRDITDEEWEKSNDEIAELQAELDEATKDVT